jgi:uncharacterized protein YukE
MAGETKLTASALEALRKQTEGISSAAESAANALYNDVLSDLMPGFAGDAAVASLNLSTSLNDHLKKFTQAVRTMAEQVHVTGATHQEHDTSSSHNFTRVQGSLHSVLNHR